MAVTTDLEPAWYLDAWSVRDGMAFASRRAAGARTAGQHGVYLTVPELEPEPTASPGSALWADRANFQPGLFDDEGREIAFPSLDAVREIVRRGYLAGGIGPGATGAPVTPPPPDDGPADGGFGDWIQRRPGGPPRLPPAAGRTTLQWQQDLLDWSRQPAHVMLLWDWLQAFARASVELWARRLARAPGHDEGAEDLLDWCLLLRRSLLLEPDPPLAHSVDRFAGAQWWAREVWVLMHEPRAAAQTDLRDDVLPGLLYRVPCPLLPEWHPQIRHLSDKLLLATSTSQYFRHNDSVAELCPSLLAAMVTVTTAQRRWHRHAPRYYETTLGQAVGWLVEQLPRIDLPTAAEVALNDFAWSELDRQQAPP